MVQRRSPHHRPAVTPRNTLERRRKYQLRSSPPSLKHNRSLPSSQGSDIDATPRVALSPLQPNLRRLPSRMRSLLFNRRAPPERDATSHNDSQVGSKRKRVPSGIENAYSRVTRLTIRLKRRKTEQDDNSSADENEDEPHSDSMEVDDDPRSHRSDKSDTDESESSSQDHLLRSASSRQLQRLRKDALVDLYTFAGLSGDADALTKPAIIDAIIAAREEFSEIPPSSPRGASSSGYSSEDGHEAGGEETDFMNGRRLFQNGMRRRATVQEFPKSAPRPLKGRSVSMNCLDPITPNGAHLVNGQKAARFADNVSSPVQRIQFTRQRNVSRRTSSLILDGASVSSPPATRLRARKSSSSGSGPSSAATVATASSKGKGKAKQVEFALSESDLTELDDLENPAINPSPRRLRSKDKVDFQTSMAGNGDAEENRRITPKRRARPRAGSLREESTEDEAMIQEEEETDELESSPSPPPDPQSSRQCTPVKRRLRSRKSRLSLSHRDTGASDGDDEGEEEEGEASAELAEEQQEGGIDDEDEGDLTEVEEPRKLRNGKILGEGEGEHEDEDVEDEDEEAEVDGDGDEGREDSAPESAMDQDVPEPGSGAALVDGIDEGEDVDWPIATAKSLNRLRRNDLVRLCETRDIEVDGTKPQLVEALLQWRDQNLDASSPSSTGTVRPPSTTRPARRSSGRKTRGNTNTPPVLERPGRVHTDEPRTPQPASTGKGEPELELDLQDLGLEDREIPPEKLTKMEKIGSGGFKDVFIGKFRGRKVAIAEFRGQLNAMDIKELKLLGGFNHPNIVRFLGVSIPENTKETPVMIISELCSNGDLFDYIRNVPPPTLRKVLQTMRDIAKGLEYLHLCKPSVIHRDCKSSNILITAKGVAKIADFGLAKVKQSTRSMVRSLVGTVNWQAPELWHAHPKYNHKVDVFSCGMVFWEMLQWYQPTKKFPWEGMNEHAIYEAVGTKRHRPPIGNLRRQWCPEIVDLMERMWAQEHVDRPNMSEVVDELETLLTKY